ncbi:uncharacterized protein [Primulina eburnea]|uniref:uncharacterized protein n=1 Tax=Primulina eburnea TaxID=1245227 RepID=UPI003C6C798C
MLIWKDLVSVTIHSSSSGHIDSTILHGVKKWRFTGFYGSPESCNRHLSWTLLHRLSCLQEFLGVPWLVGGDFNEICFDREKMGGSSRPLSKTRAFREALDACSLATEADFSDVVHQGWDKNNQTVSLPNRLKDCKKYLKAWAGSRFGTIPRQLLNKRKQLSHLQTHGQWQKSISRIGVLEHEVEELATKEELYWKQRSRVNWL